MGDTQTSLDRAKLAPLLEHMSDGVFVVDRDRRVCLFNPAAEKITGVSAGDAVGRTCHETFTDAETGNECAISHEPDCTVLTVFRTGKPSSAVSAPVSFPSGEKKTLRMYAVPLFNTAGDVARVAVERAHGVRARGEGA